MPTAYAWKHNSRHKIQAQVAGEEISRIRDDRGLFFTPSDIVEEASPDDAILHPEFEWDDEKAAHEYRKDQARHLIDHVVVVKVDTEPQDFVRAFVSIRTEEGPRYTETAYAFSVPDLREDVLSQAMADMRTFERRYHQYLDLAKVMDMARLAISKARKRIKEPAMAA